MHFLYNEGLNILWIVLGAIAIGLVVFLLRKYVPGLKGEEIKEDEKKIAEDNVKRKVVDIEQDKKNDEE